MKPSTYEFKSNRFPISWVNYAMGFFGLFLINSALTSIILYRYDPGPNSDGLPVLVPTIIVGITFFCGRVVGAFFQPLAGYFSDRIQWNWGKRRPFLAMSTCPMVVSFILLFNPILTGTVHGNSLYLLILLCIFYLTFSLYQVPYLALLPELATQDQQRIALASWLAIFSLIGTVSGGSLTPWLSARFGFGMMTLIIGLISFGALILPLLTPESDSQLVQSLPFWTTLKSSWKNSSFRPYVLSISYAWIAVAILAVCPPFVASAMLHQDVSLSGLIIALNWGGATLGLLCVKPLVKRFGKKRTYQIAMLWSGIGAILIAIGPLLFGRLLQLWLLIFPLAGLGLGAFLVLPNAMMPDVIEQDLELGSSAQAIYFGSRGFFVELSMGLGILIVGLLLSLGKTSVEPLGVYLSLATAGLLAFLSAGWLYLYPISK